MSAKDGLIKTSAFTGADHKHWRQLFEETHGFAPNTQADVNVFHEHKPPVMDASVISYSPPGEPVMTERVRMYFGPPPKIVLRFRRLLSWLDTKVTSLVVWSSFYYRQRFLKRQE